MIERLIAMLQMVLTAMQEQMRTEMQVAMQTWMQLMKNIQPRLPTGNRGCRLVEKTDKLLFHLVIYLTVSCKRRTAFGMSA